MKKRKNGGQTVFNYKNAPYFFAGGVILGSGVAGFAALLWHSENGSSRFLAKFLLGLGIAVIFISLIIYMRYHSCPHCHMPLPSRDILNVPIYCPECGAKLDETQ